jgi:hypothetical protein
VAITYDYKFNIVGDAEGPELNSASESVSLTGLTNDVDYEISVRERDLTNGIIYLGAYTLSTFHSYIVPTSLVVNLGVISSALTLGALTPFISVNTEVHDLKINHVQGSESIVAGITTNSYDLTGLVLNDNYELRVKTTATIDGVTYFYPYSPALAFVGGELSSVVVNLTSLELSVSTPDIRAAIKSTVDLGPLNLAVAVQAMTAGVMTFVDLGVVTPNTTLNNIEFASKVIVDLEPISHNVVVPNVIAGTVLFINLGLISKAVTTLDVYGAVKVVVNLGIISPSITLNNSSAFVAGASTYDISINEVDGPTTYIYNVTGSPLVVSGLTINKSYTIGVRESASETGVKYLHIWSYSNTFTALQLNPVIIELNELIPSNTLLDVGALARLFTLDSFNFNNTNEDFTIFGTTSINLQSVVIEIDGEPIPSAFDAKNWSGTLSPEALTIAQIEELDGPQSLESGTTPIEVNRWLLSRV